MDVRLTRRRLIEAAAALPLAASAWPAFAAPSRREFQLTARPAEAKLVGADNPATPVWTYNGAQPGPVIRARRGDSLKIAVKNELPQETTVHWHGVRVPNAMDGVPHLTQKPIAPGASFAYEFAVPDAGTYWYHPHAMSHEQVPRGLYGALIVDEDSPPPVDRDELWVLADWRLDNQARLAADFGNFRDLSHDGRLGNTVTLNGREVETWGLSAGERVRLRLINACSARIFALEFKEHRPLAIALDGQAVEPRAAEGGRVVLAPGERADLILDALGRPGQRSSVVDAFDPRRAYRLVDLAYGEKRLRDGPLPPPPRLAPNALSEPDLAKAERHKIAFTGGMMGGPFEARLDGETLDPRALAGRGKFWAINGAAGADHHAGHAMDPLLTFARGSHHVLELANDTAWHHPIHLHGHFFRVLAVDGKPLAARDWRDTATMHPRSRMDIALVADNPGDWMLHCHILDHQRGGMMAHIRVQ
ncbi:MAG: multicopper oxidase family protein [Rhodospirillales bacterium]